ncbi:uncharacterized protein LOC112896711 isoform X3 [Panicum hallii]|uniref:uncharacterized protein LOC112896711 isoform X3 n=1 Tax=Panicum hallii TaxID=206008 RepID=UPI000DF4EEC3|nr:uncharacterized protein LOC112896711 isoform X3 [Panicum hallii]
MPPTAAASCPLLRRAPAAPFAALSGALSRSGMARRLVAASSGGGGRGPAYGGLLLDAGGTLLQVARPVAETYASIGRRYGVTKPEKGIMEGFKRAFSAPWPKTLRYQGDGRPFWRIVVAEATNCTDDDYFEEVYQHYAHGDAWRLPVGADTTLRELKDAGGLSGFLLSVHIAGLSGGAGTKDCFFFVFFAFAFPCAFPSLFLFSKATNLLPTSRITDQSYFQKVA